jgi:hypothetical protein
MKIEILLGVMLPVGASPLEPFANPAAAVWDVFNDDLVLKRYNDKTPGNGLPQSEQERLAGTHAGTVTILRIAPANDRFLPEGGFLLQYQGTYRFKTLPNTPLAEGHVTTRGLFAVDSNLNYLDRPVRFAITGGTHAYVMARGQVTEGTDPTADRVLEFEV